MKLLLCTNCGDVRALRGAGEHVTCQCGTVTARYVDHVNAEWNGEGFLLGFHNSSLASTLTDQRRHGDRDDGLGRTFKAFVIPKTAPSVRIKKGGA